MDPRPATIKIRYNRKVPIGTACDGNTVMYKTVYEIKRRRGMVWPVYTGENKMLVELDDGTLKSIRLEDIRLEDA